MKRTKAKFKVGDKFRVINGDENYATGTIVSLKKNDGTDCPLFTNEEGENWFFYLSDLERLPKQPAKGKRVTKAKNIKLVKQPHGIIKHVTIFTPIEEDYPRYVLTTIKGSMTTALYQEFMDKIMALVDKYEKKVVPES